jgi:sialic acid synthase SpsE
MRLIAEIGSNWAKTNYVKKNLEWAERQIFAAYSAGATDVKFQFYSHSELYGRKGKIPGELPADWVPHLKKYSDSVGINFLCTAFSRRGYNHIDPYVDMHKVASCESTDDELINHVMKFGKPVMISTGGLNNNQINQLREKHPWGQLILADCVIDYPASPDQYNLLIIEEWNNMFASALSDHTHGYVTALAAQGLGATIFEKHVDFFPNSGFETPDKSVSSDFDQFEIYCRVLKTHKLKKQISYREATNAKMYQRRETSQGCYRPLPRYPDDRSTS